VPKPIEVDGRVTWSVEDKAGFVFLDLKPDDQTIVGEFSGRQSASDDGHQPETTVATAHTVSPRH
jgi:hypothetical protein